MVKITAYRAGDGPAVAAFLTAVHAHDPRVDPFEEEAFVELVRQWGDGRDFLLAKEGAALRAVGLSYRYRVEDRDAPVRFFHVVVEPSARRRGIATALIGRLEARDEDRVYRRAVLPGVAREGEQLLRARGYAPVQRILSMVRAQVALPAPSLPEGYAMR